MSYLRKLYIDDIRPAPDGWVLAYTITQAIRLLATHIWDEVSLDHDISYIFTGETDRFGCTPDENFQAVAWFITMMPNDMKPKIIHFHTGNSVGRKSMQEIINIK